MSHAANIDSISRQSQTVVTLTLDRCSLTAGVSPCTATQTGDAKCYNTRGTCNDSANYVLSANGTDYKLRLLGMPNPFPPERIRPYLLEEPTYLSTKLDPTRTITENARVTLKFADELSNDTAGIDPYFAERSYYPNAPGTFWRKLIARNEHYRGRTGTIELGFQGDAAGEYVVRQYIIDQIQTKVDGTVIVILKDFLKKADRSEVPVPNSGTVADDPLLIGASVLNYNVDDVAEYPEPDSDTDDFLIRVDDELMWIDGNNTGTKQFSIGERGVTIGNIVTVAAEHNQDAKIQMCYAKEAVNGVDIMLDLMENFIPLDGALINTSGFESERDLWLTSFVFTGVISKPMKVSQALHELQQSMLSNAWWSEEIQLVDFEAFAPLTPSEAGSLVTWNDEDNLISVKTKENEDSRVSQAVVHFNKKVLDDDDKDESYEGHASKKDSESESAEEFGEPAITDIRSRWILSQAVANTLSNRTVARFGKPPRRLSVEVELKDSESAKTADIVQIDTDRIEDFNGNTLVGRQYEVLEKSQKSRGRFAFEVLDTSFIRRYGFIPAAGTPDYDSASDFQKLFAFIGDAANNEVGTQKESGFFIY